MNRKLILWLWLSVITVIAGAFLLYPIGISVLNVIFVLIKIGMITGLIILLFLKKKLGFYIWSIFCIGAVIMTIIKWNIIGSTSFLIVGSIAVDILMPAVAYMFMKNK